MKVWIARDTDGGLYMYNIKPIRNPGCFGLPWGDEPDGFEMALWPLPKDELPEITWVNSPQEYELDLKLIPINVGCDK